MCIYIYIYIQCVYIYKYTVYINRFQYPSQEAMYTKAVASMCQARLDLGSSELAVVTMLTWWTGHVKHWLNLVEVNI